MVWLFLLYYISLSLPTKCFTRWNFIIVLITDSSNLIRLWNSSFYEVLHTPPPHVRFTYKAIPFWPNLFRNTNSPYCDIQVKLITKRNTLIIKYFVYMYTIINYSQFCIYRFRGRGMKRNLSNTVMLRVCLL